MSIENIFSKLNLNENPNMPRMKFFNKNQFELTYFCD